MAPEARDFGRFYREVHGRRPFAWQSELAARVFAEGWPRAIRMPTASGKTSVIDVAVFHLALEAGSPRRRAPLRTVFVVDRRLVVDDAFEHARRLCDMIAAGSGPATSEVRASLEGAFGRAPQAVRLRGGMPGERDWAGSPDRPLVIASTVDQAGSRLLFRGYGVPDLMRPVHAGLLGIDVLYILDEADMSWPFLGTLEQVSCMREREAEGAGTRPLPFVAVHMGATLRASGAFPPEGDMGRLLSADAELGRRAGARKLAALVEAPAGRVAEKMAECAAGLSASAAGAMRVGIVANTVGCARQVFEIMRGRAGGAEVHLLTGRSRPLERDALVRAKLGAIRPGSAAAGDSFFVATQCIEAGVDVDFDALVTQLAPLDSLRQRFGRLDRVGGRGQSAAAVVAGRDALSPSYEDPIYGGRLRPTWEFLQGIAEGGAVDFGAMALEARLPARGMDAMAAPRPGVIALMPSYVRALAYTWPRPYPDPDPSVFLHGHEPGPADVHVIWRADVTERELLGLGGAGEPQAGLLVCPPSPLEAVPVPVWAAAAWLAGASAGGVGDVEGAASGAARGAGSRPALRWAGPGEGEAEPVRAGDLAPGDTVVVPAAYGGCDRYGWDGGGAAPVRDLGMEANLAHRGSLAVRLDRHTVEAAGGADAWPEVAEAAAAHADGGVEGLASDLAGIEGLPAAWRGVLAGAGGALAGAEAFHTEGGGARRVAGFRAAVPAALAQRMLGMLGMAGAAPAPAGDVARAARRRRGSVGLTEHCRGVQALAEEYCRRACVDAGAARDVSLAALLHDAGKAEPRFQAYMRRTRPGAAAGGPYAKVFWPGRGRAAADEARRRARFPKGYRHECWSVQLAEGFPGFASARDPDLVKYLIGTHHGYGRPMFPAARADPPPGDIEFELCGSMVRRGIGGDLARLGSGWLDVHGRAYRRYGPWALAHMEAIVRLADRRRSAEEARDG